jgi:hypothetical protein
MPDIGRLRFNSLALMDERWPLRQAQLFRNWRHEEAQFKPQEKHMLDKKSTDPRTAAPSGSFSPRKSPATKAVAGPVKSTFKMKLSKDGIFIGYFGVDSSGWGVLVDGAANAVTFEPYPYGGVMYYLNHANGTWLSISTNSYAGFYSAWSSAEPCVYDAATRRFICSDGGQALSLYSRDNGYLYFWDAYGPLQVDFDYDA